MKENITVSDIINRLEKKFGNHTNAGEKLGYKHSSGYRRARREALERGSFPGPTQKLALLLIENEIEQEAAA